MTHLSDLQLSTLANSISGEQLVELIVRHHIVALQKDAAENVHMRLDVDLDQYVPAEGVDCWLELLGSKKALRSLIPELHAELVFSEIDEAMNKCLPLYVFADAKKAWKSNHKKTTTQFNGSVSKLVRQLDLTNYTRTVPCVIAVMCN